MTTDLDAGKDEPIRLGISACLLGQALRYDGGHQIDRWLRDTLGEYVEWVPVCPEVEAGFGTPREAFRLVGDPENPRYITSKTQVDHTDRMTAFCENRATELADEDLCGFVFKARSPTSGMTRVRVYDQNGVPSRRGIGLFARAFMERFPLLPVEEDGRLHDPGLRENFIERIFVMRRWLRADAQKTRGALVRFHTRHKLLILSHSQKHYRELGRLVARAAELEPTDLYAEYLALLTDALRIQAGPQQHANVLQHMLGFFKDELSADEKQELLEITDHYRRALVPLVVPLTLVNHYVRKYDQPYLREQVYLNPHPVELKLRNHV